MPGVPENVDPLEEARAVLLDAPEAIQLWWTDDLSTPAAERG